MKIKNLLKKSHQMHYAKNHFFWFTLEHDCYENIKIKLWSGIIILNHDSEIDCKV